MGVWGNEWNVDSKLALCTFALLNFKSGSNFFERARRRTTNDERRTTNDERRTTNDERRTTNGERRTTNDGRRVTMNDNEEDDGAGGVGGGRCGD